MFITPQRSLWKMDARFLSALSSLRMRLLHYNNMFNVLRIHERSDVNLLFTIAKLKKKGRLLLMLKERQYENTIILFNLAQFNFNNNSCLLSGYWQHVLKYNSLKIWHLWSCQSKVTPLACIELISISRHSLLLDDKTR